MCVRAKSNGINYRNLTDFIVRWDVFYNKLMLFWDHIPKTANVVLAVTIKLFHTEDTVVLHTVSTKCCSNLQGGNCDCKKVPGTEQCFNYDSSVAAADLTEAVLNFADPTNFDPAEGGSLARDGASNTLASLVGIGKLDFYGLSAIYRKFSNTTFPLNYSPSLL